MFGISALTPRLQPTARLGLRVPWNAWKPGRKKHRSLRRNSRLPNNPLLRHRDVIAGIVLHHVHHLVSLADDLMGALRIFRIAGHPKTSADFQRDAFQHEGRAADHIPYSLCYDYALLF